MDIRREAFSNFGRFLTAFHLSTTITFSFLLSATFLAAKGTPFFGSAFYYGRRAAFRANDFFNVHSRGWSPRMEAVFCITVLCLGTLIFVALCNVSSRRLARQEKIVMLLLCYFLLPAFLTFSLWISRASVEHTFDLLQPATVLYVLCAEIVLFFVYLLIESRKATSVTFKLVLSTMHWAFWLAAVILGIHQRFEPMQFAIAPTMLLFIAACAWLTRETQKSEPPRLTLLRAPFTTSVLVVFCSFVLFLLWGNLDRRSILESFELEHSSVVVTLQRTSCMGSCPIYQINISGEGQVSYRGELYVRTKGPEIGKMTKEEEVSILKALDEATFFDLDERAFEFCFDTPRFEVAVYLHGVITERKNVASDESCVPATGPQAKLVKAARLIDQVTNSAQWVLCHDDCIWKR